MSDYEFAENDIEYSWPTRPTTRKINVWREGMKCPKCGKEMVKRQNSKTMEFFYGCTGYPNCNNSMPLVDESRIVPGTEPKPIEQKKPAMADRPWPCDIRSWVEVMDGQGYTLDYKCPHCNHRTVLQSNYCPDCGKQLKRVK